MSPALVESSSAADEHIGAWCLYHELHAFKALVRVEEASVKRGMVRAVLRVEDIVPPYPGARHIPVGHGFEVSASRNCWNQIWMLFPLSRGGLEDARAVLREVQPASARWGWVGAPNAR